MKSRIRFSVFALIIFLGLSSLTAISVPRVARIKQVESPWGTIVFASLKPGRPPLTYLYFDITLRNDFPDERWFILPSHMDDGPAMLTAIKGVNAVEVSEPTGEGHVLVGQFMGGGGFRAIRLPVGGKVRIRNFPISYWGKVPSDLRIWVETAKQITIGGEDAASWFGSEPICSKSADVSFGPSPGKQVVSSKHSKNDLELAVNNVETHQQWFNVKISEANPQKGSKLK